MIPGVRRNDPITHVLRDLYCLPITQRIEFKIVVIVFRCLIELAPLYLTNLIRLYDAGRDTRSSANLTLQTPQSHTKGFGDRAFSIAAPRMWNSLPTELRYLRSIPTHLLSPSHFFGLN